MVINICELRGDILELFVRYISGISEFSGCLFHSESVILQHSRVLIKL